VEYIIYSAVVGGPTGGSRIFLEVTEGDQKSTIVEPYPHISQVPLAVFLRLFSSSPKLREPQTPQEKEDERLRLAINRLYRSVVRQVD
jgi:hypothetical protein